MKRLIYFLLAICFAATAFAGCETAEEQESEVTSELSEISEMSELSESSDSSKPDITEPELPYTTIDYHYHYGNGDCPMQDIIDELLQGKDFSTKMYTDSELEGDTKTFSLLGFTVTGKYETTYIKDDCYLYHLYTADIDDPDNIDDYHHYFSFYENREDQVDFRLNDKHLPEGYEPLYKNSGCETWEEYARGFIKKYYSHMDIDNYVFTPNYGLFSGSEYSVDHVAPFKKYVNGIIVSEIRLTCDKDGNIIGCMITNEIPEMISKLPDLTQYDMHCIVKSAIESVYEDERVDFVKELYNYEIESAEAEYWGVSNQYSIVFHVEYKLAYNGKGLYNDGVVDTLVTTVRYIFADADEGVTGPNKPVVSMP